MNRANPNHAVIAARMRVALTPKEAPAMTVLTIERDVARDFASTLRACRAMAKAQGRAGAQAVRQLAGATRKFARVHRATADGIAAVDRIHSLAQRAIALGIAPTSVRAWSTARYSRARLENSAHV